MARIPVKCPRCGRTKAWQEEVNAFKSGIPAGPLGRIRIGVPRGILAKNFIRDNKEKGEESDIIDFLTTNLMLNVIAYPDFIGYDYQDADYFALKLTRLMGAPTSTWTLKDPAHYEQVKGEFDLYTFEGFAMQ